MGVLTILGIGVALAMDSFTVAVGGGIRMPNLGIRHALKIALFFGFFQAAMPVLGWFAGLRLHELIADLDHWVAFALLCLVGAGMIRESRRAGRDRGRHNLLDLRILCLLSLATSIDALAVGLSFALLDIPIALPALLIGVITFVLSFLGALIGSRLGQAFERSAELVGGVILIAIGFRILISHMSS